MPGRGVTPGTASPCMSGVPTGCHCTAPGSIRLYLRVWLLLKAELLGLHQVAAHAVQPHVPAHPKTRLSQVSGWKRWGEAPSSAHAGTSLGLAPPWVWTAAGSASRGKEELGGGKDKINWVTLPFAEAEDSSPQHGKGGRRGPGLLPRAYLLSAPVLTSIPARSGKRKVGGRKTCKDKRTSSYCTSASRKGAWERWDGCAESGDLHPGLTGAGSNPAPWEVRGAAVRGWGHPGWGARAGLARGIGLC